MRLTILLTILGAAALAALAVGCQAQPAATDALAVEAALLQRIEAEVGDAPCTSNAQCRTLAIGAKACGGPARWLAWSGSSTSAERLAPLAKEMAQRQRRRIDAAGMMSNCSVVADPGAVCLPEGASASQPGRCVLVRTRSAN